MDSMRSLNTSLPTPYTSRPVPPEQLLQAFKSAALSVTNLYKSAVQDQNTNRASGYQDALDDLLRFLDSENLGLQDGEGWRIRQWATERYDGTANHPPEESEDEAKETTVGQQQEAVATESAEDATGSQAPDAMQSADSPTTSDARYASPQPETNSSFKFNYPSETSTMLAERGVSLTSQAPSSSPMSEPDHASAPVHTVHRMNRGNRSHPSRQTTRTSNRTLNSITGTKRKSPWSDVNFFDLGNMGPKDGPGPDTGNKRGRFA